MPGSSMIPSFCQLASSAVAASCVATRGGHPFFDARRRPTSRSLSASVAEGLRLTDHRQPPRWTRRSTRCCSRRRLAAQPPSRSHTGSVGLIDQLNAFGDHFSGVPREHDGDGRAPALVRWRVWPLWVLVVVVGNAWSLVSWAKNPGDPVPAIIAAGWVLVAVLYATSIVRYFRRQHQLSASSER